VESLRVTFLRAVPRRNVAPILLLIIAAAAVARLLWLDLMEFKADEAEACRLALHALGHSEPGVGKYFPTSGTVSSLGFSFPPLFIYVLALPLAIARNPVAAAGFIAVTNVVAVWLSYVAGRLYFSARVGLISAALFALSPAAIVYSRKIWAPNLLPICSCLFLIALHAFLVERRPRAALGLVLLVGVAFQFHFSAGLLVVLVAVAFVIGRDTLRWRYLAVGLGGVAVLYAPYIWYIVVEGYVYEAGHGPGLSAAGRFAESLRDTLTVGSDDRIPHLLGTHSATAFPVSLAFGIVSAAGLAASCRGWRFGRLAQARALLALWFILPLVALTLLPIKPQGHYFTILYPLPFFGMAVVLQAICQRWASIGSFALAGSLAMFALWDAKLFRTVDRDGGAPGEYGIAYKYKAEAVKSFVRHNSDRRFELRGVPDAAEYRFLEWNARGAVARPLLPPVTRYVVSAAFNTRPHRLARDQEQFGPLQVTAVPLG
jgi:4-amino-4-deoxy-L-arabinose transferase-like glycosyltransferase